MTTTMAIILIDDPFGNSFGDDYGSNYDGGYNDKYGGGARHK